MKVVNKNNLKKGVFSAKNHDFHYQQKQQNHSRRDSLPLTSYVTSNQHVRQTYNNLQITNIKNLPICQDQSTVAWTSGREISNSKKGQKDKLDCKILTLKEIKNSKIQIINDFKIKESQATNRKIFISISKKNQIGQQKPKNIIIQPRLAEIGGKMSLLKSISNKRKMVDNIELQIEQNIRQNRFFCV